jgi:hypothetical protein
MNASDNDREIEVEELLAAEELDPSDFALLNSLRAYYDERDPSPTDWRTGSSSCHPRCLAYRGSDADPTRLGGGGERAARPLRPYARSRSQAIH